MKANSQKENKSTSSYLCNFSWVFTCVFNLRYRLDFSSEYLDLELNSMLNLPLRVSFWYSSKWQFEYILEWLYVFSIRSWIEIVVRKSGWYMHWRSWFWLSWDWSFWKELKLCSWISNPCFDWRNLKTITNKRNTQKNLAPVFTGKFLWVISR